MKIGTIGTGFIVEYFIRSTKEVDNVEVVACYSRELERARSFADLCGVPKAYDVIEEMLSDEDIDTIYVASPNSLHFSQTLQALQAKKHVITEKPFTSTLEEFDILCASAKANNVMLWEAITSIYTPNLNIIKDHLQDVGDIKLVTCNFSQFSSRYGKYKNGELPNVFNPEFSGGCLMDINIYNLHFALYLLGKPKAYKYYANLNEHGVDMSGTLILVYDDFIATLVGAKDSDSTNYACIQGDKGTITMEDTSPGVCLNAYFQPIKEDKVSIGVQQNYHMTYEIHAFERMLSTQDYETCYELLDYSRDVIDIIEHARKEAGIYYSSDR